MVLKTIERRAKSDGTKVYGLTMAFFQLLNISLLLGVGIISPGVVQTLANILHVIIGSFLIWQFRPSFKSGDSWLSWEEKTITALDRNIAFSAGFILLEAVVLSSIFSQKYIKTFVESETNFFRNTFMHFYRRMVLGMSNTFEDGTAIKQHISIDHDNTSDTNTTTNSDNVSTTNAPVIREVNRVDNPVVDYELGSNNRLSGESISKNGSGLF
jgi:hypothetical protein